MESSENYNFSILKPRNLHGRKNRNVILSMLLIWVVAVFGFQFLLKAIEKPVPEKSLLIFEKLWPQVQSGDLPSSEAHAFLTSLLTARGKGTLNNDQKKILSEAISSYTASLLPPELRPDISSLVMEMERLRLSQQNQTGEEFLNTKMEISELSGRIMDQTSDYTGLVKGSLEASIFMAVLQSNFPASMNNPDFGQLDEIMSLYMTHNRSVLTDSVFLGFPFHYFYTAVFLLILFIVLCIIYNILIERRLKKEGIIE